VIRFVLTALAVVVSSVVVEGCCRDKVCRTADMAEAATCCGDRKPEENNCNACSSQPSCGWCDEPAEGYPHCLARGDGGAPAFCKSGWKPSPDVCAAPLMPPGGLQ
jgi:hypothetical protein